MCPSLPVQREIGPGHDVTARRTVVPVAGRHVVHLPHHGQEQALAVLAVVLAQLRAAEQQGRRLAGSGARRAGRRMRRGGGRRASFVASDAAPNHSSHGSRPPGPRPRPLPRCVRRGPFQAFRGTGAAVPLPGPGPRSAASRHVLVHGGEGSRGGRRGERRWACQPSGITVTCIGTQSMSTGDSHEVLTGAPLPSVGGLCPGAASAWGRPEASDSPGCRQPGPLLGLSSSKVPHARTMFDARRAQIRGLCRGILQVHLCKTTVALVGFRSV